MSWARGKTWTWETIRTTLMALHGQGHSMRCFDVKTIYPGLVKAARAYGYWADVLEEAGIPYDLVPHKKWSEKKVLEGIRNRHRKKKSLRSSKTEKEDGRLVDAARRYFGSWGNAVDAAGFDYDGIRWGARWTEERILEAIRNRISQGKALNVAAVQREESRLFAAATRTFGSWRSAVEAFGLDYGDCRKAPEFEEWSREKIIAAFKKRGKGRKRLNYADVIEEDSRLCGAACRHFGSFAKAVEAAGFDYKDIRLAREWSEADVLEEIGRLHSEGADLSSTAMAHTSLLKRGVSFFGSWENAARAAGIDYDAYRRYRRWDEEKVIGAIRELHEKRGKISFEAAAEEDGGLPWAACHYFGSWSKAAQAAGFRRQQVPSVKKWTAPLVLDKIRDLRSRGKELNSKAISKNEGGLSRAGTVLFGSWEKAVRAAGIDYDDCLKRRKWSKEKIIKAIKQRVGRGREISQKALAQEDRFLYVAGRCHFGSWENAVRAAGINYDDHRANRKWDEKKVLAAIEERLERGKAVTQKAIRAEGGGLDGAIRRHFGSLPKAVEAAREMK